MIFGSIIYFHNPCTIQDYLSHHINKPHWSDCRETTPFMFLINFRYIQIVLWKRASLRGV